MLLLCVLLALASGAVQLEIQNQNTCNSFQPNSETFRVFAQCDAGDIIRAIDANLVAGPNTVITRVARPGGNQAPVGPAAGTNQECRSFVAFNQVSSGVTDLTWATPDFVWTDSNIAKGWFLADPTSQQRATPGSQVLIAQFTVQRTIVSECAPLPKLEGTLNIILNGTRQNVIPFCVGQGCFPSTGACTFFSGHIAPIEQQPSPFASASTAYTRVYALQVANAASILLDVSDFQPTSQLPTLTRNATLGLGPLVNGKRKLLEITYHSDGSEGRVQASSASVRRVIVTRVSTVNPGSSNAQCPESDVMDLIRDRQYSVSELVSTLSRQRVTLQVEFRNVVIDLAGLPNGNLPGSFDFCAEVDWRIRQALIADGVAVDTFDHRVNQFSSTATPCGRYAAQLGSPSAVGSFTHYGDLTGCQNVNAVLNGLLRNFGLERSDAMQSATNILPGGDFSDPLGRTPSNAGWQRRGLNAAQQVRWGVWAESEIALGTFAPQIVTLHSTYYPGPDTGVFRTLDLSNGYYASYRSASDPLVDRMANVAVTLFQGEPNPGSFVGKTVIHRLMSDGTTRFVNSIVNGESYSNGVLSITQRDSTRYRVAIGVQGANLDFPLFPALTPTAGVFHGETIPTDTSTQTSNGGANPLQSNNALPVLALGLLGTDQDPVHYVRVQLEVPRFSVITDAKLQLQATSRQTVGDRGALRLEVAVEAVGNSGSLTQGSNLFPRSWSSLRQTFVVDTDQYQHDVIELPINELLQSIVDRDDFTVGSFVSFRIRNDPNQGIQTEPATREVYSGDLCGPNYGGGSTPCGPRVVVNYVARTTSPVCSSPSINSPAAAEPLSNVNNPNDGLTLTISESGSPAHAAMLFIWTPANGVASATLTMQARVVGTESFEVQYARSDGNFITIRQLNFSPSDTALTSRSASLPVSAFTQGALTIRIRDRQTGSNAASSIIIDHLQLCAQTFNVDCILSSPGLFSRCPPCDANPQSCAPLAVISQPLGNGAACGSLETCQACTPTGACPLLSRTLTVTALVSLDSQQQWKTTQTGDLSSVDLYDIPGMAPARIGIAGKALSTPGTTLPGGFWVSDGFNLVPGTSQCVVVDAQLTCPSGDPLVNAGFQGSMECKNGQIPGPTTPATTTFTIECN